jgi:hypothetical protein
MKLRRLNQFILAFALAATIGVKAETTNAPAPPKTAREFYNAGTRLVAQKKFAGAEEMFVAALAEQDERIQPRALFNLGDARFADGVELLKKGPDAQKVSNDSRQALAAADNTLAYSESALAQNDLDKMVAAYLAGRGARHELIAAQKAVRAALETSGNTLRKWQRAADDFKSAAELNPADTNAVHNAAVVAQQIARLVDQLRQMQAMAGALGDKKQQLNQMLGQLKGRIPAQNAPPGGEGDDDEDDEGLQPDALAGQKEGATREGEQRKIPLSPDQAGQILDGLSPDGARRLPMSDQSTGKPQDRNGRNW